MTEDELSSKIPPLDYKSDSMKTYMREISQTSCLTLEEERKLGDIVSKYNKLETNLILMVI